MSYLPIFSSSFYLALILTLALPFVVEISSKKNVDVQTSNELKRMLLKEKFKKGQDSSSNKLLQVRLQ